MDEYETLNAELAELRRRALNIVRDDPEAARALDALEQARPHVASGPDVSKGEKR